jgi:hypothetical protein
VEDGIERLIFNATPSEATIVPAQRMRVSLRLKSGFHFNPSRETFHLPVIVSSSVNVPMKRCEKSGAAAGRSKVQTLSTNVIAYTRVTPRESS